MLKPVSLLVFYRIPYEAYATPENVVSLWENSEEYKVSYKSGICEYNESKINLTVGKAIDAGRKRYEELLNGATGEKTGKQIEPVSEKKPEYTEEEAEEARKIYERGEMLEELVSSCHKDHQRDDTMIKVMLLSVAAINVINSGDIHIAVTGKTGCGKSHAAETVVKHIPQSRLQYSCLSDKALFYNPVSNETIIVIDDEPMSDALQGIMKQATSNWDEPPNFSQCH